MENLASVNKTTAVLSIVILLLLASNFYFYFSLQNLSQTKPTEQTTTTAQYIKDKPATDTIFIFSDHYDPTEITIKAGQKVSWVNKDNKEHIVVFKYLDKVIFPEDYFTFTFYETGTQRFFDGENENMKGQVIVEE